MRLTTPGSVRLREVADPDLDIFFTHQQDGEATNMAAFTKKDPSDRAAFDEHWSKIHSDAGITIRTVLVENDIAGHVASFRMEGDLEVTYWIGREFWGQGVATRALSQLLEIVTERPLHARAAKDNVGSRRVLEKCGFVVTGYDTEFANARGEPTGQVVLELKPGP